MKELSTPTLAEDLLLLLFQPTSGAIAGEQTIDQVLGGAVVAELACNANVTTAATPTGSVSVRAVNARAPSDQILRSAWDHISARPGAVKALVAAIGSQLRQPLLERLVVRGDIREQNGKVLGMLKTTSLKDGGTGRRTALVKDIRHFLVDGVEPTPRVAALAALIWGSGTLHQVDPEIPISSALITRARALEPGGRLLGGSTPSVPEATEAMLRVIAASVFPQETGTD